MAAEGTVKISVLADGRLLLGGSPATLEEIAQALEAGAKDGATVWYYRENADGEAPPAASAVLKLITGHRLLVRLCRQADFSDSETPGASPLVQMFAAIRAKAQEGNLVIVRPDGRQTRLPVQVGAMPAEAIAGVERLLPSKVKRNVAVIADTAWAAGPDLSLATANQAIPFFGMLMGFGAIGHAVWIFDFAGPAGLAAGCQDADVAIVDSARLAALPPDWQAHAGRGMRGRQILVHDRATYQLRKA